MRLSRASGEPLTATLDSVTITGGLADRGGGILVRDGSPTILRNVIVDNRAREQGSGVLLERSSAGLFNNLMAFNGTAGGDPHSVEIQDAAPTVVNNTIARGDSNGLIIRGDSPAVIMNNVIATNGSTVGGAPRGRGICDFSGGRASIHNNLFHRNRVAALLTDGRDFRHVRRAQRLIGPPRLAGNLDGRPEFPLRMATGVEGFAVGDYTLRPDARRRARDHGNPTPAFTDLDGSRNDIGFTGGPLAPGWLAP